eukprot:1591247-Rhodomonas_salina.4
MDVPGANGCAVRAAAEMGMVEIVEPHDRAFFKADVLDVEPGGRRYLVRSLVVDSFVGVSSGRTQDTSALTFHFPQCSFQSAHGTASSLSWSVGKGDALTAQRGMQVSRRGGGAVGKGWPHAGNASFAHAR